MRFEPLQVVNLLSVILYAYTTCIYTLLDSVGLFVACPLKGHVPTIFSSLASLTRHATINSENIEAIDDGKGIYYRQGDIMYIHIPNDT